MSTSSDVSKNALSKYSLSYRAYKQWFDNYLPEIVGFDYVTRESIFEQKLESIALEGKKMN